MKKIKYLLQHVCLVGLFILLTDCKREMELIPALPPSGKHHIDYKGEMKIYELTEYVLIKNPPKDIEVLKSIIYNYWTKNRLNDIPDDVKFYIIDFYRYNKKTANYLENEVYTNWWGDKERLSKQHQYFLGAVYLRRCEKDFTAWEEIMSINITPSEELYKTDVTEFVTCNKGDDE